MQAPNQPLRLMWAPERCRSDPRMDSTSQQPGLFAFSTKRRRRKDRRWFDRLRALAGLTPRGGRGADEKSPFDRFQRPLGLSL
jgi:hypothetical protein